jgi:hypothetical protein
MEETNIREIIWLFILPSTHIFQFLKLKAPRIIFKVLNFECIISKSIVFTSFLLTSLRAKLNIKFC